jgi:serine/threonine protein kinase
MSRPRANIPMYVQPLSRSQLMPILGTDQFQLQLGRGAYGEVVQAVNQNNRQLVAIKIMRARGSFKAAGQREISILRELRENGK